VPNNLKRLAVSSIAANALDNTVFAGLASVQFDDVELARLFSREQQTAAKGEESAAAASVGRISLLPVRRANNLSIVLSQFRPRAPHEVVAAIVALDASLPSGGLSALAQVLPTDDEVSDVKRFLARADSETAERLGDAERFVAAAMTLRGTALADTVECLLFRSSLEVLLTDVNSALQSVRAGCTALKESAVLRQLLAVTLSLGNKLNQTSSRGIRLESLLKLRDTRIKGGKLTALHYVVDLTIRHAGGELPPWRDALPGVFSSTSVSLAELSATLSQLERAMDMCASLLDEREVDAGWRTFMRAAAAALCGARVSFDDVRALLRDTAKFFGEPETSDASDFFAFFVSFFAAFDRACSELKQEQALVAKRSAAGVVKQARSQPVSPQRKARPAK